MNELAVVKPEDLKIDLVVWHGYSIEAQRTAEAIQIIDDVEEGMAVDALSKIKTFQKQTEEARKTNVEPFNLLVKRVNAMFKPISESLDLAEGKIKEKVKFYRMEKERVRQVEEAKRLAEYNAKIEAERKAAKEKGEEARIIAPPPTIMEAPQTSRGEVGAATAKKFWNYEVVDIHALYSARPDLVTIEPKRRDILVACGKSQTIPGLRVFEDMQIAAR
jgi:NADH dehydrogenase/NADH:ubiquinone oxidoreductase subunit G